MSFLRKGIASFFAILTLAFTITCHSYGAGVITHDQWAPVEELAWVSPSATPGWVMQERSASTFNQVWRVEISIPGLFFRNETGIDTPKLKIIRKIYVVDPFAYIPCKSVFLYPFHEFS